MLIPLVGDFIDSKVISVSLNLRIRCLPTQDGPPTIGSFPVRNKREGVFCCLPTKRKDRKNRS